MYRVYMYTQRVVWDWTKSKPSTYLQHEKQTRVVILFKNGLIPRNSRDTLD